MKHYLIWNVKKNCEETFTHRKLVARRYYKSPDHDVYELSGSGNRLDKLYEQLKNDLSTGADNVLDGVEWYIPVPISRKRSDEHNDKISKKMTGRSLSEEHKQNISDALKGNMNRG